ncbi:MAG TPA: signal peptidase II [Chthoniobacteraceae bacterium]
MAERNSLTARLPAAPRQGPYPLAVGLAIIMLGLDQFSKFIVTHWLALPQREAIDLLPFFALRWEENTGVSMSLLRASDEVGRWLLVGLTATICAGLGFWLWREKRLGRAVALGLILGGALGNIIDRINHGFVVDFADLHFGEWRPFLIFNFADAAISIGVILLLGISFLSSKPGEV